MQLSTCSIQKSVSYHSFNTPPFFTVPHHSCQPACYLLTKNYHPFLCLTAGIAFYSFMPYTFMRMEDELHITLTNDYAFKRLLGAEENKPILQDLLACILDLNPQVITGLDFMDKELSKEVFTDKTGILDIKLKLSNNTVIDIEIQAAWHPSFVQRTLFYWAKMYTADFKAGESYVRLHKCITINIVANGFRLNNAVHSEYLLGNL